ncbi:hypothetical protein Pelo_5592 [Pelomyxa schiedti]|nr:hypothetical protein Pelo_5592 [Pelomyxa schiedti]
MYSTGSLQVVSTTHCAWKPEMRHNFQNILAMQNRARENVFIFNALGRNLPRITPSVVYAAQSNGDTTQLYSGNEACSLRQVSGSLFGIFHKSTQVLEIWDCSDTSPSATRKPLRSFNEVKSCISGGGFLFMANERQLQVIDAESGINTVTFEFPFDDWSIKSTSLLWTFLLRGSSSSSSSSALHGDDSSVDVECGVCSRKTSVDIGDVLYDHDLDRKQQELYGGTGSVCSLHGGMSLVKYCVNDKKLVCSRCVLESHQRHNLTEITSQHRVAEAEVSSLLKAIQRERESLEHSASYVEDSIDILTTRQQIIAREIKTTFERLMKELQRKKDKLLSSMMNIFSKKKGALNLHLKCTRSTINQLTEFEWKSFIASQSALTEENSGIEQATSLLSLTQNPIIRNWNLADEGHCMVDSRQWQQA